MRKEDRDQLNLLTIFHYVLGGLTLLVSLLPLLHLAAGIVMIASPETFDSSDSQNQDALQVVGIVFIGLAIIAMFAGFVAGTCMILAGRFLNRQTHYIYCMIIAALECLSFPFGTALGVFTLVVLSRESVKWAFGRGTPPPAIPSPAPPL